MLLIFLGLSFIDVLLVVLLLVFARLCFVIFSRSRLLIFIFVDIVIWQDVPVTVVS